MTTTYVTIEMSRIHRGSTAGSTRGRREPRDGDDGDVVIAKRGDGHNVTFNVGQRSNDTRGTIRQGFVMRIVEFCGRT
jgi:hypothetical protein